MNVSTFVQIYTWRTSKNAGQRKGKGAEGKKSLPTRDASKLQKPYWKSCWNRDSGNNICTRDTYESLGAAIRSLCGVLLWICLLVCLLFTKIHFVSEFTCLTFSQVSASQRRTNKRKTLPPFHVVIFCNLPRKSYCTLVSGSFQGCTAHAQPPDYASRYAPDPVSSASSALSQCFAALACWVLTIFCPFLPPAVKAHTCNTGWLGFGWMLGSINTHDPSSCHARVESSCRCLQAPPYARCILPSLTPLFLAFLRSLMSKGSHRLR